MTTDYIEAICKKLGTTIDNLIPAVTQYEIHMNTVWLILSIIALIAGLALLAVSYILNRSDKYYETAIVSCLVFGALLAVVGLCMAIGFGCELHAWNYMPTIKAYKTIFGYFGGY